MSKNSRSPSPLSALRLWSGDKKKSKKKAYWKSFGKGGDGNKKRFEFGRKRPDGENQRPSDKETKGNSKKTIGAVPRSLSTIRKTQGSYVCHG